MRRVDAHCHLWSLSRGDYDWLSPDNVNLRAICQDFEYADIAPLIKAANVHRLVLVQAAASEAETDFLLSIADRHDDVAGVVGWVDLTQENAGETLTRWSNNKNFKGIRPMLQDIDNTHWLLEAPRPDVWSVLADNAMCFDALVQPRHLPMLNSFCTQFPDIPVVINHAAKPNAALSGSELDFSVWEQHLAKLASHPQVHCKLSGLLTELPKEQLPNAKNVLRPYVNTLIQLFGCDRLMWGSDWPVLTLASEYSMWNKLSLELLHELSVDELTNVLGATADKFYALR